jgi:hypothetical protein
MLRFAEKPAGINVASKSAGRDSAKIVNASRVRAVIKAGSSSPTRVRPTTGWRRAITRSLILLYNLAT